MPRFPITPLLQEETKLSSMCTLNEMKFYVSNLHAEWENKCKIIFGDKKFNIIFRDKKTIGKKENNLK